MYQAWLSEAVYFFLFDWYNFHLKQRIIQIPSSLVLSSVCAQEASCSSWILRVLLAALYISKDTDLEGELQIGIVLHITEYHKIPSCRSGGTMRRAIFPSALRASVNDPSTLQ